MKEEMILIKFDDIELEFKPDKNSEWLLSNEQVALGYEVGEDNIRYHKKSHSDELFAEKHYISVRNPYGGSPQLVFDENIKNLIGGNNE